MIRITHLSLLVTHYSLLITFHPRHLIRTRRIPQTLAARLDNRRLRSAVPEDRLHEIADRACAVDRAVARIIGIDHLPAVRRPFEFHAAELLILIVKERVVFEELRQLVRVENLVDLSDPELRGGGADEREHVRMRRFQSLVNGAIELDERGELAPRRGEGSLGVLRGFRGELREKIGESLLADRVEEELLAAAEHHSFDFADGGIGT